MSTLNPAHPSGIMRLHQLGHDYPSLREGDSRSSHASGDLKGLTLRGGCTMSTFNPTHPLAIMRLHLLGHKYPYIKKGGGAGKGEGKGASRSCHVSGGLLFCNIFILLFLGHNFNILLFFHVHFSSKLIIFFPYSLFQELIISFHIYFFKLLISFPISTFSHRPIHFFKSTFPQNHIKKGLETTGPLSPDIKRREALGRALHQGTSGASP